ncbi:class I SAM-dependent methyltransferase [Stieleria sp. TO1_6]|uniref:class I SAM-dependent methyltransferase n=1 Tax=Stieleria tagensis TaxID=2956795 RepID=UPI00209A872C|nr:class I SAM-dependent methyltransferase [Stieleria tagensis]MCO8122505.1 class I SAM-dependent methyltransferase [Stieleria tagensis]
MKDYRRETGIKDAIRDFQLEALGDLKGKRVLDLGCYDGNSMSLHLARSADYYLGADLSTKAIDKLNAKLVGFPNAEGKAVDFLSTEFSPQPFDVIYANSVMHHFEHFDAFLSVLRSHLKPGGYVVSFDPLETAATIRVLRWAYRPFQKDADWEWPFQKSTFAAIEKHFQIDQIQGFLGKSKWPIFLTLIPGTHKLVTRMGVRSALHDYEHANQLGRPLWRCMQVAMKLVRNE